MTSAPPSVNSDDKRISKLNTPELPLPIVQKSPTASPRTPFKSVRVMTSNWARLTGWKRDPAATSDAVSCSSVQERPPIKPDDDFRDEAEAVVVDQVIVDRSWSQNMEGSSILSESDAGSIYEACTRGSPLPNLFERPRVSWITNRAFISLWHLTRTYTLQFFSSKFSDPQKEADYQKEVWGQSKIPAFWACGFFITNWVLGTAFLLGPVVLADKIFYYAVRTIRFSFSLSTDTQFSGGACFNLAPLHILRF